MSQYNDALYGVEPYTGKIICHGGRPKGSKNGYSFGQLVDAAKVAKGKLLANGRYVYDNATNAANYVVGRVKSGQLGSRTINNATNAANYVVGRVKSGQLGSRTINNARTAAGNIFDTAKTGVADTLMKSKNKNAKILGNRINKTTKRYKDSVKKSQNMKAASARNRAAESRGNRYIYENRTLAGNIEREGRKIRSAVGNAKNALSRVGKSIVSAPGKAVNKVNNASTNATSRYQNFANNVNQNISNKISNAKKGAQDWWDTYISGKKYKKNN